MSNQNWEVECVGRRVVQVAAWLKPKASSKAGNVCLRRRLLASLRRNPRLRLRTEDRRTMILACRWLPCWRKSLSMVKPEPVLASQGVEGLLALAFATSGTFGAE